MDTFTESFLYIVFWLVIAGVVSFLFLLLGASTVWFNDKANDKKLPKDVRNFFKWCGIIAAISFIMIGLFFSSSD